MLVFVLMAEGWLRDSGPINFFLGPSILRSHVDLSKIIKCSVKLRLCQIERKMRDEEVEV